MQSAFETAAHELMAREELVNGKSTPQVFSDYGDYFCPQSEDFRKALQTAMRGIEKANPETLYGIFGDAAWSNTDRLPDALLRDLVLGAEDVRVVLGEGAHPHQAVQRARRLVAVDGAELRDLQRQLAI